MTRVTPISGNNRSRARACAYNGLILFSCHKCHGPRFPGFRLLLSGQMTRDAGMTGVSRTPLAGPPGNTADTGKAGSVVRLGADLKNHFAGV